MKRTGRLVLRRRESVRSGTAIKFFVSNDMRHRFRGDKPANFMVVNKNTNTMNTGKALLGVVAGIAAGAVLGVLFAPEKGSTTRKNILDKSEDMARTLNDKIDEKFNELTDAVSGKIKKARAQYDTITNKAETIG